MKTVVSAEDQKDCKETADVMVKAVQHLGCDAYLQAQNEDCLCVASRSDRSVLWVLIFESLDVSQWYFKGPD